MLICDCSSSNIMYVASLPNHACVCGRGPCYLAWLGFAVCCVGCTAATATRHHLRSGTRWITWCATPICGADSECCRWHSDRGLSATAWCGSASATARTRPGRTRAASLRRSEAVGGVPQQHGVPQSGPALVPACAGLYYASGVECE